MYLTIDPAHSRAAALAAQPRLSIVMVVYMTGPALMESVRHALAEQQRVGARQARLPPATQL